MPELETWRKELYGRTLLKINQEMLDSVLEQLEPQSQDIVNYLWRNRHTTIVELADLIDAPTHMDILLRIKGVINPTTERVIGSPLLVFEKSRVDAETGEVVLFSWCLISQMVTREADQRTTRVDIFDEGDRIDIVADLTGLREEDITLRIVGSKVIFSAEAGEYYQEITLPSEVNSDKLM